MKEAATGTQFPLSFLPSLFEQVKYSSKHTLQPQITTTACLCFIFNFSPEEKKCEEKEIQKAVKKSH